MIPRRYTWLLRDTATAFDGDLGHGHACRICRATERGETRLRARDLDRHLSDHRREKLVNDDQPTLTVVGATEEN